jgi:hypothetical protein
VVALALIAGGVIINHYVDRTVGFFMALAGVGILVFSRVASRTGAASDTPPLAEDPELLTAEELADRLGVRADCVYTLVAREASLT